MANINIIKAMYAKKLSPLQFKWQSLVAPPLLSLLTPQDIYNLHYIASSNRLASKPQDKYKMIDQILTARNFKKIASGTNRVCYKYLEDQSICIKVAIDKVGLRDNPDEYRNQFLLAPFVVKVFEISPCGTVGLFERVEPITTKEEFELIADDVFDLIVEKIIGKYVVQDIGSDFFQNFGIRLGWGPVLLDFPYVYELDGGKLYCNNIINDSYCLGDIDYDSGFNNLICTKCGKLYLAKDLKKQEKTGNIIVKKGDTQRMKIILRRGNEVVNSYAIGEETRTIDPTKVNTATLTQPVKEKVEKAVERPVKREVHEKKNYEQQPPMVNSDGVKISRYRCACGNVYGKSKRNTLCNVCGTRVVYQGDKPLPTKEEINRLIAEHNEKVNQVRQKEQIKAVEEKVEKEIVEEPVEKEQPVEETKPVNDNPMQSTGDEDRLTFNMNMPDFKNFSEDAVDDQPLPEKEEVPEEEPEESNEPEESEQSEQENTEDVSNNDESQYYDPDKEMPEQTADMVDKPNENAVEYNDRVEKLLTMMNDGLKVQGSPHAFVAAEEEYHSNIPAEGCRCLCGAVHGKKNVGYICKLCGYPVIDFYLGLDEDDKDNESVPDDNKCNANMSVNDFKPESNIIGKGGTVSNTTDTVEEERVYSQENPKEVDRLIINGYRPEEDQMSEDEIQELANTSF